MIYLITNRKIDRAFNDQRRLSLEPGDGLSFITASYVTTEIVEKDDFHLDETRIERGWKLREHEDAAEMFAPVLDALSGGDERALRPWVLFVHGNNQDGYKNLEKCRKLAEVHNVNVVAFSWPSRPVSGLEQILGGVTSLFGKQAIGGSAAAGFSTPMSAGISILNLYARQKYDTYKTAKENALNSVPHLAQTFELLSQHLIEPLQEINSDIRFNVLVHSLGNLLMSRLDYPRLSASIGKAYKNILLHQADVDHQGHTEWVGSKTSALCENTLVTVNRPDQVLFVSYLANSIDEQQRRDRLGRVPPTSAVTTEGLCYVDFTDGVKIGAVHNLFHMEKRDSVPAYTLVHRMLEGDTPPPYENSGLEQVANGHFRIAERSEELPFWEEMI